LANIVKRRVETWVRNSKQGDTTQSSKQIRGAPRHPPADAVLAAVNSKLEDGNIRAAVRILSDESRPVAPTADNFRLLLEKHPQDPIPESCQQLPDPITTHPLQVTEAEVAQAVRSFPAGSSGGPDGLRPGHLAELINHRESSALLLKALTDFTNLVLAGGCPTKVRQIFFGGNLIALSKKSGGIRPIAIGYTLRRLVAKCANRYATVKLAAFFSPLQVGLGVPAGCEGAIHAARRFLVSMQYEQVFVKLDFANAFNSLRRDVMLQAAFESIPELYHLVHQAYALPSILQFGKFSISSQMGPQQGDPLGPLLFCLPLQNVLKSLKAELCVGYLDDLTLGGTPSKVAEDLKLINSLSSSHGLTLNRNKCEFYSPGTPIDERADWADFRLLERDDLVLLGAPLFSGTVLDETLAEHCETFTKAVHRLTKLPSQNALILLRSCFGAPKISHLLRCSPCTNHPALTHLDECMRDGLESIINIHLDDIQWTQATLPIRDGGLGVRCVGLLASSAYLASAATTQRLQAAILSRCQSAPDDHVAELLTFRHDSLPTPTDPLPTKQWIWDRPLVEKNKSIVLSSNNNPVHQARLLAVSSPHAGDWLTALPIPSCGLILDNEAVRVAVGLRLGLDLCHPHPCKCGSNVGSDGHHGFVCRLAFGRAIRHHEINDIIWRALQKADTPSTKEPAGLFRSDGKRPDGATLIPWSKGKYMCWDATVVHTCAASYLSNSSLSPASEHAANNKIAKYSGLPSTHVFIPIAFETLGPINSSAIEFLNEVGRRLTNISGEKREPSFLFQRLSVCIQRRRFQRHLCRHH
jgi:hypothetical protein